MPGLGLAGRVQLHPDTVSRKGRQMDKPEQQPPRQPPKDLEQGRQAAHGIFLASGGNRRNVPRLRTRVQANPEEENRPQSPEAEPK